MGWHASPRLRSLGSMYLLHAANLGWPLVTIPFLTRALGPEIYAAYGLTLTWCAFAALFAEFGLGVLGTKRLAGGADGPPTFGRIVAWQSVNSVLVLVPLLIAMSVRPLTDWGAGALVMAAGITVASALTPLWYFVARSAVAQLLPAVLVAKIASALLVILALPAHPSIELALFCYLLTWAWVFSGLASQRRAVALALRQIDWSEYRAAMRSIAAVPGQRIGTALYTLAPATIAATYFGMSAGAMYLLAERVVRALMGLFQPVTSHLLPLQLAAARPDADAGRRRQLRYWIIGTIAASALLAALVALFGQPLAVLVGGQRFADAGDLIRILSPLIFLITVNGIVVNRLYALDRESVVSHVVWLCGGLFVLILALVGKLSLRWFTVWCMLVELAIALGLLAALWSANRSARNTFPNTSTTVT